MTDKKILIKIEGHAGAGKTTVAAILSKALEDCGVRVNYEFDEILDQHLDGRTLSALIDHGMEVDIVEVRARRNECSDQADDDCSWLYTLSNTEMAAVLRLGDGEVFDATDGVVWMRLIGPESDEFKVSPHGDKLPDLEAEWVDRDEVLDVRRRLWMMSRG